MVAAGLLTGSDGIARCWWCGDDPLYQRYHDTEWGHSLHGESKVFEKLVLEGFQSGLSWITILRKRDSFRAAFAAFDIATVARFGDADRARLLADPGIVRNRAKIDAAISNAQATMEMLERGESLDALCWSFQPSHHQPLRPGSTPAPHTVESTALSTALRARGLRFVGPTTVYAFMQSAGIVDDHVEGCATRPVG